MMRALWDEYGDGDGEEHGAGGGREYEVKRCWLLCNGIR